MKRIAALTVAAAVAASLMAFPFTRAVATAERALVDIIKGTARIEHDIPMNVNDLTRRLARSKSIEQSIETEIEQTGKLSRRMTNAERAAAHTIAVARILERAAAHNPGLAQELKSLDPAMREVAAVMAKGGERLATAVPDIAARGQLLRRGGGELVAAVGLHGEEAARDATRLDAAIQGSVLVIPRGARLVTLADFGRAMTARGGTSWKFHKRYIAPNWNRWLTSGALALFLANPEQFQNEEGRLTKHGFDEIARLAGKRTAAAIRGVDMDAGEAAEQTAQATYQTPWHYPLAATLLLLSGLLYFKRIRYYVLWPLHWLHQTPVTGSHVTTTPITSRPDLSVRKPGLSGHLDQPRDRPSGRA